MKKKIIAKYFAHSILRDLGQETFEQMRYFPISRAMLERGNKILLLGPNGSKVIVEVNPDVSVYDISVHDHSFESITVQVPSLEKWGSIAAIPRWLKPVFDSASKRQDLFVMSDLYDCKLTLTQLSKLIGWNVRRLVAEVLAARDSTSTVSQHILIGAVEQTALKPAEWLIDIRGYALSLLVGQMMPEFPHGGALAAD